VKNANKYWTEAAASHEFGIASTTLRHAWVRGDIETVTTACGLTLLYGPSLRKYSKRHRPRNKISGVIRRRRAAVPRKGTIHAVPASSMPDGMALCGTNARWGPAMKGDGKKSQLTYDRCKERAASKNVS
jgi:hypothetical protein